MAMLNYVRADRGDLWRELTMATPTVSVDDRGDLLRELIMATLAMSVDDRGDL